MRASRKSIDTFLEPKKMAITGVTRNPKKFGYQVYSSLKKKGYDVYPVNPMTAEIDGDRCYPDVSGIPADVNSLLILNSRSHTVPIVKAAVEKGIHNIWIQQMSETPEAIDIAKSGNVNLITGQCIFMFAEKVEGFHRFHRGMKKIFGALPK
jgi:uncharacterized protein